MNEEEKKAIDNITKIRDRGLHTFVNDLTVLLNLIEKQQKEIEKLHKTLDDDIGNIVNLGYLLSDNAKNKKDVSCYIDECQIFLNTLNYNYISKQKIQKLLEEN